MAYSMKVIWSIIFSLIALTLVSGQESSTTSAETAPPSDTTSEAPTTTTEPPTTPFPDEGYECTVNGPFPHPTHCEYYYDCTNGLDTLIKCQGNYLFDLRYYGCNYPELTDCQNRTRPEGYPGTVTPPEGSTTTPLPGSFTCPEEDGNYPDDKDCTAFYQCYEGVAHHINCPFPLEFNIEMQICDHPGSVDCGDRPVPGPSTTAPIIK